MEPAGRLKRLAVAVLVDDIYNPGNKSNPRQKRSPEELKSIEDIAKASVGFDSARGDILTVQNIGFQIEPAEVPPPPSKLEKVRTTLINWSNYVRLAALLLLFALTYLLVLRPVKKQLIRSLNAMPLKNDSRLAAKSGAKLPEGDEGLERVPGARPELARLKDDIAVRVKQEPTSASRLVQSWIRDGERG
jgi:flagellar M-ring protein FliF